MTSEELDSVECYYFGVWGQPGHYTFNRHRQGIHPNATPGEVPTFISAERMDQRFCRPSSGEYLKDAPEGLAHLTVLELNEHPFEGQRWTILAFNDRSGDERPGSNSAFVARGVFLFRDMLNIVRVQYPTLWNRMTARFEITEAR